MNLRYTFDVHLWCNQCQMMIGRIMAVLPGPDGLARVSREMSSHNLEQHSGERKEA